MDESNEARNEPNPRKFTLTSLIVIIAVCLVLLAMLITFYTSYYEKSNRAACGSNLSNMYKAMHVYLMSFGDNKNYMPHTGDAFWTCLLGHPGPEHPEIYSGQRVHSEGMPPLFGDCALFVCPNSGSGVTSVKAGGKMDDYMGPSRHPLVPSNNPSALADGMPRDWPIACDKPGNHKGGGVVLRFEGSVVFNTDDKYTEAVGKCVD